MKKSSDTTTAGIALGLERCMVAPPGRRISFRKRSAVVDLRRGRVGETCVAMPLDQVGEPPRPSLDRGSGLEPACTSQAPGRELVVADHVHLPDGRDCLAAALRPAGVRLAPNQSLLLGVEQHEADGAGRLAGCGEGGEPTGDREHRGHSAGVVVGAGAGSAIG